MKLHIEATKSSYQNKSERIHVAQQCLLPLHYKRSLCQLDPDAPRSQQINFRIAFEYPARVRDTELSM